MILALDTGNTNIVFGGIKEGKILFKGRLATDKNKTDTEYAVMFKNILNIHGIKPETIRGVVLSSVVPPLNRVLCEAARLVTGHTPFIVSAKENIGLEIEIDNKFQLGHDMIVDAVAALDAFSPPLLIIDMGTATTISVLDQRGVYVGTVIIPGVKLSQDALSAGTSQLPSISYDAPMQAIGKNTIDSMKSGLVFGNAAMLDGMIDRLESELGQKATIVATGGLSGSIIPHCRHKIFYDDDLLLKGLWLIYQRQK